MSHPLVHPLRPFSEPEREALQRVSRAPSETVSRPQRAMAFLAVADGMSLLEAARTAVRRFNERGLTALDDLPRSGHPRRYGPTERARIEQELRRSPWLKEDGTHEAGYTWQQNRTWCKSGTTLHKGKDGVEERHDPDTGGAKNGAGASLCDGRAAWPAMVVRR